MRRPTVDKALSHWSTLVENFDVPVKGFYAALTKSLEAREIPSIATNEVTYHEGGPTAPRRAYLSITRQDLTFDICAAPFGTGFFFSWWLSERRIARWLTSLFATLLLVAIAATQTSWFHDLHSATPEYFGFPVASLFVRVGLYIALLVVALTITRIVAALTHTRFEDAIVGIPVIGRLFRAFFKPMTYYRADTIEMFRASVHAAILEVINELTTSKGLLALNENQKKPVMREFYKR